MNISRWTLRSVALIVAIIGGAIQLPAQGVTSGAVGGTITNEQGQPVEAAQISIVNRSTGFRSATRSRANGYYLIQGLDVGGPYTVTVRRIGFEPNEINDITVSLSTTTRVDVRLTSRAVTLTSVQVTSTGSTSTFSPSHQGVGTSVADSIISKMPMLGRNFTDLVKLTPQVVLQTSGGPSAGGQYNRYNSFNIDGASQNDRFNLNSSGGQPGAAGNGRLISPDAIKEFRVLMSPTDVRQANFTGMLVNAVTKSGTNEFHGGALYNFRNENFSSANFRNTKLDVKQYGFQLGGPIIRDKLHFYIAPEWQERTSGATGAFVGQAAGATGTTLNISPDSIALVQQIIKDKMGFDPGTAGKIDNSNPLRNLFGRLDWQINDVHRLVVRQIANRTESVAFSRNSNTFRNDPLTQNTGFKLGSNMFNGVNTNNSTALQLYSNFSSGAQNEVLAGFNQIRDKRLVPQITPEMSVGVVPVTATGTATTNPTAAITFGTEQFSIGNKLDQDIYELSDNLTLPYGDHTFTLGARYEHVHIFDNFPQGLGGVWVFPNIAALNTLKPSGYAIAYPNSGNPADIPADFTTDMSSVYAQDQWALRGNFTITAGLRADVPNPSIKPVENSTIAQLAAAKGVEMHTSWTPKMRAYFSPRIGFNWDISHDQTTQLRGNVGVFTGPPPFILLANAQQNTGLGLVRLSCTGTNVPAFTIDESNMPHACLNQPPPAAGAAGTLGVNLNDPNFKYPQYFVTSAGFDKQLPYGVVATFEGLYRHAINGVWIRDLNLIGPRMVNGQPYADRNGRILYADTILANGSIRNDNQRAITRVNGVNFTEGAIYVTNQSKDYNYSLSAQLRKTFGRQLNLTGSYTYMQAKDVQSLTSDRAISNWRFGREYSGVESDPHLTTSAFQRPHRVMANAIYTLPWHKYATSVTLYYEGISGTPISYVSSNDLNGDGFSGNDPIYVPKDATDPNEIKIGSMTAAGVFTQDAAAAQDFNKFISGQECLNKQRGKIMERNSCRTPWQNRMDLAISQSVPTTRGQSFTIMLDVINIANVTGELLQHIDGRARDWGKTYGATISAFPQQTVLSGNTSSGSIARTPGPINQSMPVYTFNATARARGPYDFAGNIGYNMQLTMRYTF
jgi:outer membrane receptor for ferrienterochelin and colicin